jgi:hypothetical protein
MADRKCYFSRAKFYRLFKILSSMKRILLLLAVVALTVTSYTDANAQIPDGSVAPNFTVTDLDGNEHTLYEYLDAGIPVIIDLSATWCGPCWDYHIGATNGFDGEGALHHLYNTNGPDGTNEVMILSLEADDDTTNDDLNGTGTNTAGDWVTGTPYPICDNTGDIFDLYQCTYYPTIFTVCPNRLITETGQGTYEAHLAFVQDNNCQPATEMNDPALFAYTGETTTCDELTAAVDVMNMGTTNMSSFEITVDGCENCPIVEEWTGDAATYEVVNLEIPGVQISGAASLDITITSMNDNTANDNLMQAVSSTEGTTHFRIRVTTDCWPDETSWSIHDASGTEVASGGAYTEGLTEYVDNAWVDSMDCYEFRIQDAYEDGLNGAFYAQCGVNGSCVVTTVNDDGSENSALYNYDGSYFFAEDSGQVLVTSAVSVESIVAEVAFNVYPNPVNDVANVQFAVANASEVTLNVLNMLGQTVFANDLGTVLGGEHRTEIDFSSLDSGMYLVNLTTNGETQTIKVTVTK